MGSGPFRDSDAVMASAFSFKTAAIAASWAPLASANLDRSNAFFPSPGPLKTGSYPATIAVVASRAIDDSMGYDGSLALPLSAAIAASQQMDISGVFANSKAVGASGGIHGTAAIADSPGLRLSAAVKASPMFPASVAPPETPPVNATSGFHFSDRPGNTRFKATDPLVHTGAFEGSGELSASGFLPRIDLVPGESGGGTRVAIGVGVSVTVVALILAVVIGVPVVLRAAGDSSSSSPPQMDSVQVDTIDGSEIDFEEEFEGRMYDIEFLNPVSDSCDAANFGEAFSSYPEESMDPEQF
jgi:hypothetical protein